MILLWIGVGWIAIIAVVWRILYVLHQPGDFPPSPELLEMSTEMPTAHDCEELPAGGERVPNSPR